MADGLDRAVLRAGEDLKPRPQPPDGLMVCTVDRAARAVQLAQKARRGVDGMQPVNAVNLTVALDVLTQRAAKIDVEDLQPAADADDRLSLAQEVVNQRELTRVACFVEIFRAVQCLTVKARVHVAPAGQQQNVRVLRRFGEGYIAKSDLLQVETRLSDAEYQLQTARRAYAEVLHAFNSQFGAELDRAARLAESITDTLPMPVRVTAGDMLSRRPDILAAAERVTAAEHAVDVTRAAYNPQVSIGAGGSWQTFTSPAAGRTYLDASLTMAVSVPIFRWGARRHAVSAAGAAVRGTEYALASARDAAAREEADGWSALTSSRAQMFSSLRNLKIAGENLDISTYSYNEGQATILDVLQAQLSWIQIYTNTITAQFNYAVAVSAYKRITASD